jgi:hypothetical protein
MANHGELEAQRDRTIELLTRCYSRDLLRMEEYETRVERAGQADSSRELFSLLADMPQEYRLSAQGRWHDPHAVGDPGPRGAEHALTREPRNVTAFLSSRSVDLDTEYTNAVSVLSSLEARVPPVPAGAERIYIQVFSLLGEVTVVVPPNVRVENRLTPILAEVKDKKLRPQTSPDAPVVQIDGFAFMSDVEIRTRKHY